MDRRVASGMTVRLPTIPVSNPIIRPHGANADRPLGEDEVDEEEDLWADHDEDCHGEIDKPWMRQEFPEGFRWVAVTSWATTIVAILRHIDRIGARE